MNDQAFTRQRAADAAAGLEDAIADAIFEYVESARLHGDEVSAAAVDAIADFYRNAIATVKTDQPQPRTER